MNEIFKKNFTLGLMLILAQTCSASWINDTWKKVKDAGNSVASDVKNAVDSIKNSIESPFKLYSDTQDLVIDAKKNMDNLKPTLREIQKIKPLEIETLKNDMRDLAHEAKENMNTITPIIKKIQLTIKPEDIESIKNQVEKSVNYMESLEPLIEKVREIKPEDIERIKSKISNLEAMKNEIENGIHTLQPILKFVEAETATTKTDTEKETSINELTDTENNELVDHGLDQ